ncbi:hypothetical protein ACFX13_035658 [Malus domestica]
MVKTPKVLKTEKKLKVRLSLPRKSLTLWGVLAFLRGDGEGFVEAPGIQVPLAVEQEVKHSLDAEWNSMVE